MPQCKQLPFSSQYTGHTRKKDGCYKFLFTHRGAGAKCHWV